MKQKKRKFQGEFGRVQWLFFWEEERCSQQKESQKQRHGGVSGVWATALSEVPCGLSMEWEEGMVPELWLGREKEPDPRRLDLSG